MLCSKFEGVVPSELCRGGLSACSCTLHTCSRIWITNRGAAPNFIGKSFDSKLSGDEVYRTNAFLWLMKIMLCSKLHCQKGFDLILF
jgi:hypothetical protein